MVQTVCNIKNGGTSDEAPLFSIRKRCKADVNICTVDILLLLTDNDNVVGFYANCIVI